jgi:membrane associated rhomboid family serine protease
MVSLLGGSTAVVLFADPEQYVAGASGAVFGLMSGLFLVLLRLRRPYGQVVAIIVLNLVITQVVPGISMAGHVGGLVVGGVAAAALVFAPPRRRTLVQTAALALLTAVLLALIAAHVAGMA